MKSEERGEGERGKGKLGQLKHSRRGDEGKEGMKE